MATTSSTTYTYTCDRCGGADNTTTGVLPDGWKRFAFATVSRANHGHGIDLGERVSFGSSTDLCEDCADDFKEWLGVERVAK